MHFLAFSDNPLGHVVDIPLIGGEHPVIESTSGGMVILSMHMVSLLIAGLLCIWLMTTVARKIGTGPKEEGNERYLTKGRFSQMIEVIILYLRDKAIEPVLGEQHSKRYLPFLLTLFFFILVCNIIGLIPFMDFQHLLGHGIVGSEMQWTFFGGTATSNLAVTASLAVVCFVIIQVHAFRELGIKGWLAHLSAGAPIYLLPIMLPVELFGMIIKPTALAIRLFANMVAGHTLMAMLALFGKMAFTSLGVFGLLGISFVAVVAAVAISFLELFVAFLQAFIFMFLTTVFINQMTHHHEEHQEEEGVKHATVPTH
ncbi:MAG: F0F1 ATP synthase subunit A [Planctomycetota bacterium]|nr:F0F1 ATP synthase subunit A [Planctomycetota bacterium]